MAVIKIALVQMDICRGPKENLKRSLEMIDDAVKDGADIICLPELFITGFDYDYIRDHSEEIPNEVTDILSRRADEADIYILAGSIPEKVGDEIYNTSVFFGIDGRILGSYSKTHLFSQIGEKKNFAHGKEVRVFDTDFGTIGITICYDLRFPELFRKLSLMGAELIFVPSEFPVPKLDHWRTLLKARAIENQIYVVGINRVGKDDTSRFFGHSMVVDPRGNILKEAGEGEEIIYGSIDLENVEKVREKIFYLDDRISDLY